VILKWFHSLSRRKTFVAGKCALPSVLVRPVNAVDVLCAQLTRDLFVIAKFLF